MECPQQEPQFDQPTEEELVDWRAQTAGIQESSEIVRFSSLAEEGVERRMQ